MEDIMNLFPNQQSNTLFPWLKDLLSLKNQSGFGQPTSQSTSINPFQNYKNRLVPSIPQLKGVPTRFNTKAINGGVWSQPKDLNYLNSKVDYADKIAKGQMKWNNFQQNPTIDDLNNYQTESGTYVVNAQARAGIDDSALYNKNTTKTINSSPEALSLEQLAKDRELNTDVIGPNWKLFNSTSNNPNKLDTLQNNFKIDSQFSAENNARTPIVTPTEAKQIGQDKVIDAYHNKNLLWLPLMHGMVEKLPDVGQGIAKMQSSTVTPNGDILHPLGKTLKDIGTALGNNKEQLGQLGNLLGDIINNNAIAKNSKLAIRPTYLNTFDLQKGIYGDLGTRNYYNNEANKYRHIGSQPVTSDASTALAARYEAEGKANELEEKGYLADNANISKTRDEAWKVDAENAERRTNVANTNRGTANSVAQSLAMIENGRRSANWQSIKNYVNGINDRIDQKNYLLQTLQLQKDEQLNNLQVQQILNDPKYIALNKTLQDVYTKNNGDMSNIDVTTAKRNRDDYLAQLKSNIITQQYNNKIASINNLFKNYSFNLKKGGKIEVVSSTDDSHARVFHKFIKDNTDIPLSEMKQNSRFISKLLENQLFPKVRKLQQGGGMPPFTIYQPAPTRDITKVATSILFGDTDDSSSSKSKDKSDDSISVKDILQLTNNLDALPSDMTELTNGITKMFAMQSDLGEPMDSAHMVALYASLQNQIKNAQFAKKSYDEAIKYATERQAIDEVSISPLGQLAVYGKDGFKYVTLSEYNKNKDELVPLTNGQLLRLRAYDMPKKASLIENVMNCTSTKVIDDSINNSLSKLGSDSIQQSGYTSLETKGMEQLNKIIQDSGAVTTVAVKQVIKQSSNQRQVKALLNYLGRALPRNSQILLMYKFGSIEEGLESALASKLSNEQSSDQTIYYPQMPKDGSTGEKGNGQTSTIENRKASVLTNMQYGIGGVNKQFELNSGTTHSLLSYGTYYSSIPRNTNNLPSQTSLARLFDTSSIGGIVSGVIQFGDSEVKPDNYKDIAVTGGGVSYVILPTRTDRAGNKIVDFGILDRYSKVFNSAIRNIPGAIEVLAGSAQRYSTQQIQSISKQISNILRKNGLGELTLPNGRPDVSRLGAFWVLNGRAVNKSNFLNSASNKFIKKSEDDQEIKDTQRILGVNSGNKGYDFETHFFGDDDELYKGTIYIPISNNALQAQVLDKQSIDYEDGLREEQMYRTQKERYNANPTSSSSLNLN